MTDAWFCYERPAFAGKWQPCIHWTPFRPVEEVSRRRVRIVMAKLSADELTYAQHDRFAILMERYPLPEIDDGN